MKEQAGVRPRGRSRVQGVDALVGQKATGGQAPIALHIAHRIIVAQVAQQALHTLDILLDERTDIGVHHSRAGPRVLTDLGQQINRQRYIGPRHFCPNQLGDTPLVFGMQERPDQRDGHGLNPLFPKVTDTAPDIGFVERDTHLPRTQHALFDREPQSARNQHGRLGKIRVVAVPVFLMAKTNFERVFVTGGAEQAGLGPLVFDQGVDTDGRAENDQVAVPQKVGHATATPYVRRRGAIAF